MPSTSGRRPAAEVVRLGTEIYERDIRPTLQPEDDHKFIAVDIATGDHEIDGDDYTAVMRLRSRRPTAEIYLGRIGEPTTCKIRRTR